MLISSKVEGILIGGAIGDALGWPFEFYDAARRQGLRPGHGYVAWKKRLGGRYFGFDDEIKAGDYSDDTQLTLAIARCIDPLGGFQKERFAYEELPLWLQYERGGGRATKHAVRSLISRKSTTWCSNFFTNEHGGYRNAGANGAAMRCAPLVIANFERDLNTLAKQLTESTIVTHGHPRAIIGTYLIASALLLCLEGNFTLDNLHDVVGEMSKSGFNYINENLKDWKYKWNEGGYDFEKEYDSVVEEAFSGILYIKGFKTIEDIVDQVGAATSNLKGSGIGSVLVAISAFYLHGAEGGKVLSRTAYLQGSDTDTISSMLGWLVGASYGLEAFEEDLVDALQDKKYLISMANTLFGIASVDSSDTVSLSNPITDKREYISRVWAWEIGLFELFWESIDRGSIIHHPTLGRGLVMSKITAPVDYSRQGSSPYFAANVKINFTDGQSCSFHSILQEGGLPQSSLTKQLEKIVKS